nr:immunoglobulin heavy chain junction region [Mus musculus]NSM05824.1 immunoglobulin heavy chain junction region [Mus musculus]
CAREGNYYGIGVYYFDYW